MLTTAQVAARLGVTPRRVQALIQTGRLRAVKPGHDWLIAEEDLASIAKRHTGRPSKKEKKVLNPLA